MNNDYFDIQIESIGTEDLEMLQLKIKKELKERGEIKS